MKKAIAYILLSLFLFNSSLHEFVKLPKLYAHFTEHKKQDKSISFLDFLQMHYGGNDLNDNDQDRDMELPFKKIDNHSTFEFAWLSAELPELLNKKFPTRKIILPAAQDVDLTSPSRGTLFRPPIA